MTSEKEKKKSYKADFTQEEADADTAKRKQIRLQQSNILSSIQDEHEKLSDIKNISLLSEARNNNNEIFEQSTHTREQLNDAIILKKITHVVKNMASNFDNMSRRYNFDDFADCIKTKFVNNETGYMSWEKLGVDIASLYSDVPKYSTFYGPLKREIKAKKARALKVKDNLVHVKPDEIIQDKDDDEDNEATNERLKYQLEVAGKLSTDDKGVRKSFELLRLLVDPLDAVQTVENFFDFSFMVKEKRVLMKVDLDSKLPIAVASEPDMGTERRQMVLSMNMKQIKELMAQVKSHYDYHDEENDKESSSSNSNKKRSKNSNDMNFIKDTCILHRVDELYTAKDAREQADILEKRQQKSKKKRKKE